MLIKKYFSRDWHFKKWFLILFLFSSHSFSCGSGHWIKSISNGIIKLEDNSVWKVDPFGRADVAFWSNYDHVEQCDDALINTSRDEKVSATQIR